MLSRCDALYVDAKPGSGFSFALNQPGVGEQLMYSI